MDESSTTRFILTASWRARGVKVMVVHVGLLFTGLIIRTVLAVVVLAVFVWLALKLGRLADAYTERISGKKG